MTQFNCSQQDRHRHALRAVQQDVREPERLLGRRSILGDTTRTLCLTKEDADRQCALFRSYRGQLGRIARLARDGGEGELRTVVANVLSSRAAKTSVLARLAFKDGLSLSGAQIVERSAKLNVEDFCYDPVVMILKEKDDGSFRTTLDFGWRHKARQMLVRDILYASGVCNEFDFNFRAYGPNRAVRRIVQAIDSGRHYWLTFDIKDCFASVKPEHLHGMTPLKDVVLRRVAFLPASVPIQSSHTNGSNDLERAARRGLAQGSMASGPLASALLGREIRLATIGHQGVVIVVYADDIAIGARTQGQIDTIKHAISGRLLSLSGGPLFFKFCKISHASSGFDFIQRHLQRKVWDGVHRVHVQPSQGAFARLERKLLGKYGEQRLHSAMGQSLAGSLDESSREVIDHIKQWAAAMDWPMQPQWEEVILMNCFAH